MTVFYPVPEFICATQARFIQIMNTANSIAKAGHVVKLLCGRQLGQHANDIFSYYDMHPHPNLDMVFLPVMRRNISWLPFSFGMLFKVTLFFYLLVRAGSGVIFVRHPKLAAFLLRIKSLVRLPVIFEAHEIFHLTTERPKKQHRLKKTESYIYANADGVITISNLLREELLLLFHLHGKPIVTIPNAVKSELLNTAAAVAVGADAVAREGLLYAGGLYPWKGVDVLIKAMAFIPGEVLTIVGGGDRLDELKQLAADIGVAGRIVFTGYVEQSQLAGYLSRARIAIIPNILHKPSIHSSPLKMFEFMALGLPIVASNIPGITDVLTDKVNVLLFEPGNVMQLATSVRHLIDNPAYAAEIAAKSKALAGDYTYDKRATQIMDFIASIVERGQPGND
ncbi:MAG: glycosyltransferase family 4 protein [Nitrospirae bacterium]|uniref:glycosyltransferase family 4 protein n=1 Tax=Candidatus Magnetobacterium casense TaxID=1455061 RepID=UPI00058FD403|nr:glycosyltransferase family 4 protein [Candidatus Magnetobacterium casensis]MBF0338177.1 glycosyltransferase family 4 protein [Nitrospirota bacterium]